MLRSIWAVGVLLLGISAVSWGRTGIVLGKSLGNRNNPTGVGTECKVYVDHPKLAAQAAEIAGLVREALRTRQVVVGRYETPLETSIEYYVLDESNPRRGAVFHSLSLDFETKAERQGTATKALIERVEAFCGTPEEVLVPVEPAEKAAEVPAKKAGPI